MCISISIIVCRLQTPSTRTNSTMQHKYIKLTRTWQIQAEAGIYNHGGNTATTQEQTTQHHRKNFARSFLNPVDTHFPSDQKLHKISNWNTVKVSYSYLSNVVRSTITVHNTRIIRKSRPHDISADNCNCRNKQACPLQNKCMSKDIVYQATISTNNTQDTKQYLGMTSGTFKE